MSPQKCHYVKKAAAKRSLLQRGRPIVSANLIASCQSARTNQNARRRAQQRAHIVILSLTADHITRFCGVE